MRSVSGKRFCKTLEAHGWELRRIRGSHHIYSRPGESAILSVPVHGDRDLKKGMLSRFLKLANITEAEL